MVCAVFSLYTPSWCWCRWPEIGTSSIDWAQLNRFYLKTQTESSLRNVKDIIFVGRKVFIQFSLTALVTCEKRLPCTAITSTDMFNVIFQTRLQKAFPQYVLYKNKIQELYACVCNMMYVQNYHWTWIWNLLLIQLVLFGSKTGETGSLIIRIQIYRWADKILKKATERKAGSLRKIINWVLGDENWESLMHSHFSLNLDKNCRIMDCRHFNCQGYLFVLKA
jgi:hypothetical protein